MNVYLSPLQTRFVSRWDGKQDHFSVVWELHINQWPGIHSCRFKFWRWSIWLMRMPKA